MGRTAEPAASRILVRFRRIDQQVVENNEFNITRRVFFSSDMSSQLADEMSRDSRQACRGHS